MENVINKNLISVCDSIVVQKKLSKDGATYYMLKLIFKNGFEMRGGYVNSGDVFGILDAYRKVQNSNTDEAHKDFQDGLFN